MALASSHAWRIGGLASRSRREAAELAKLLVSCKELSFHADARAFSLELARVVREPVKLVVSLLPQMEARQLPEPQAQLCWSLFSVWSASEPLRLLFRGRFWSPFWIAAREHVLTNLQCRQDYRQGSLFAKLAEILAASTSCRRA